MCQCILKNRKQAVVRLVPFIGAAGVRNILECGFNLGAAAIKAAHGVILLSKNATNKIPLSPGVAQGRQVEE